MPFGITLPPLPPLPSPRTVLLAARITVAAVPPVVKHGDLRAVKHLPFVLTHLDDAAVVAGAIADPVGTAIDAPGAAARFGVRTTVSGARFGAQTTGRLVRTPGRFVTGPLRRR